MKARTWARLVPVLVIATAGTVWLVVLTTMEPTPAPAGSCGQTTPAPTTVPGPGVVAR